MSIEGILYFVTFIDDYTRHTWACLIAKKSEVFACFLMVKSLAERETRRKIVREVRWWKSVLSQPVLQLSRYTPHQKGMAERKNRTIEEAAEIVLAEKHMPKFY